MKNRIEVRLQELKERGEKAFITYMTAGLPDMETTKEIIKAQEQAGTDVIELGIPFSDPAADGPVIQEASYRAIQKGVNLAGVLKMVREVREECRIPLIFMMYYNTALHYGLEQFVSSCIGAGVDGLIIPDLPMEEQGALKKALQRENAPILIQLVSPVSAQRVPQILDGARGFVYCVSNMGVTGQGGGFYKNAAAYLEAVKKSSPVPVMLGFGIREAGDIEPVKKLVDGCIVGSHFIRLLEESGYDGERAADYIRTFKKEMNI